MTGRYLGTARLKGKGTVDVYEADHGTDRRCLTKRDEWVRASDNRLHYLTRTEEES